MTAADPRDGLLPSNAFNAADWAGRESRDLYDAAQMHAMYELGKADALAHARPEAVDEAMARRLDDYLGGEFDIRIGKQAAHAALTAALTPDQSP